MPPKKTTGIQFRTMYDVSQIGFGANEQRWDVQILFGHNGQNYAD